MKSELKTFCFVMILSLVINISACSRKEPKEPQDIESVRAGLRQQVARGELTKEEAIVRLAEATAKLGSDENEDIDSPALKELSKKLKEQVEKGELSEEEATTIWIEAAEKAKSKSSDK